MLREKLKTRTVETGNCEIGSRAMGGERAMGGARDGGDP